MCFVVEASVSWGTSWESFDSRGRIMALSLLSPVRRGRVFRVRVVASKRWLQKRQCWVRILWRGMSVVVGESDIVVGRLDLEVGRVIWDGREYIPGLRGFNVELVGGVGAC